MVWFCTSNSVKIVLKICAEFAKNCLSSTSVIKDRLFANILKPKKNNLYSRHDIAATLQMCFLGAFRKLDGLFKIDFQKFPFIEPMTRP